MHGVLAYAPPRPRQRPRYASLPGWIYWLNGVSIALGAILLGLTLSADDFGLIFIGLADLLAFVLHFLVVFLPTFTRALLAEQVAPIERIIGLLMACAGPTGIFLMFYFWPC